MGVAIAWRRRSEARRALVEAETARAAQILARMGAHRVVLFGSQARGDAGEASDVDLLVVMPWDRAAPVGERAVALLRRLAPSVALDLVVYTPEEFARLRVTSPLVRRALSEGRSLLERA